MLSHSDSKPSMPMRPGHYTMTGRGKQRGFALLMGLILLIMLSIVAVVVMKGSVLEAQLTTATARHEQSFEASEAARLISETVLKQSIVNFAGNWPSSWGGTVPDISFGTTTIFANRGSWLSLLTPAGGNGLQFACGGSTLINLFTLLPCASQNQVTYNYTPSAWQTAFKINTCPTGTGTTCSSSQMIQSNVSVLRDGTISLKGCQINGGSYAAGATMCTATLLQVRSAATLPGSGGKPGVTTIAQFQFPNQ